jgi:hypothetical protein
MTSWALSHHLSTTTTKAAESELDRAQRFLPPSLLLVEPKEIDPYYFFYQHFFLFCFVENWNYFNYLWILDFYFSEKKNHF